MQIKPTIRYINSIDAFQLGKRSDVIITLCYQDVGKVELTCFGKIIYLIIQMESRSCQSAGWPDLGAWPVVLGAPGPAWLWRIGTGRTVMATSRLGKQEEGVGSPGKLLALLLFHQTFTWCPRRWVEGGHAFGVLKDGLMVGDGSSLKARER